MTFDQYARRLRGARFGHGSTIVVLRTVGSSNELGKRLAREHLRDGRAAPSCDLVAWQQTAGRGRGDHRWSSPAGAGVWATQVRPVARTGALQMTPLAVAVGIVEALRPILGDRCRLAWPNDVMLGARKLAGILVEGVTVGEGCAAVIGFGVNHHPEIARFDTPAAASVGAAADGAAPGLGDLAVALLEAVDAARARPPDAVLAAYRGLSVHRPGEALRCRTPAGEMAGTFTGFDEHGFLLLRTPGGERVIAAAEVTSDEP